MSEEKKYLTLAEASHLLPGRPHASTLWRWCRRGLKGVRLAHLRLGAKILTTRRDIEEFGRALADLDAGPYTPTPRYPRPPRSSAERAAALTAAKAAFEKKPTTPPVAG